MAKLKDIAEQVGVSISTVSRVMQNDTNRSVSEETRRKIWETAERIGYRPNRSAKSKKPSSKAAFRIGCIVAMPQNKYNNPYFSVILEGIERELQASDLRLEFIFSIENKSDIGKLQAMVAEHNIDGMIVVESIDPEAYLWIKTNVKMVVGIDISDKEIPVVSYDRMAAAKEAVETLISLGHRHIGYIGGAENKGDFLKEKRYLGYQSAMQEAGLPIKKEWVIDVKWDVSLSYGLTKKALESHHPIPTAIFAASDMMAIAAMRAITEQELKIPDDMAIFGLDNIEISEFTSPPLSTVHVPKMEMGMFAVKLLLDYLKNQYSIPIKMIIPYRCLHRKSTNSN